MNIDPAFPGFEGPWLPSDLIPIQQSSSAALIYLEPGIPRFVDMGEHDSLNLYANNADMLGMRCLPTTVSDFIVEKFKVNPNIRAVLVGESNEIHHVWVLLEKWTQEQRKAVYAVQRDILQKVRGFNFDFYVVDIPEGTNPSEMVSGIPLVYQKD